MINVKRIAVSVVVLAACIALTSFVLVMDQGLNADSTGESTEAGKIKTYTATSGCDIEVCWDADEVTLSETGDYIVKYYPSKIGGQKNSETYYTITYKVSDNTCSVSDLNDNGCNNVLIPPFFDNGVQHDVTSIGYLRSIPNVEILAIEGSSHNCVNLYQFGILKDIPRLSELWMKGKFWCNGNGDLIIVGNGTAPTNVLKIFMVDVSGGINESTKGNITRQGIISNAKCETEIYLKASEEINIDLVPGHGRKNSTVFIIDNSAFINFTGKEGSKVQYFISNSAKPSSNLTLQETYSKSRMYVSTSGINVGTQLHSVIIDPNLEMGDLVSNLESAPAGVEVVLTVDPSKGIANITDKNGQQLNIQSKAENQLSFIMPNSDVELTVEYTTEPLNLSATPTKSGSELALEIVLTKKDASVNPTVMKIHVKYTGENQANNFAYVELDIPSFEGSFTYKTKTAIASEMPEEYVILIYSGETCLKQMTKTV